MMISICIPAYKRQQRLKRLLDSIAGQTFRDFEVLITDDSPDFSIKELIDTYKLEIRYFKNEIALGTPANWNYCISKAKGEWIKMMHDDDWFSSPQSLELFWKATFHNKKFIFSAYRNLYEEDNKIEEIFFPLGYRKKIVNNPMLLLPKNIIGPPSVTLVHQSILQQYDTRMKWRVDIDFYMRTIETEQDFFYIDDPLISVGLSTTQVTNSCLNNPEVELPEGLLLLSKFGVQPLKNVWIYDTWWRLMRNMEINTLQHLHQFTGSEKWPEVIENIVKHQSRLKKRMLKIGLLSKFFMLISYFINRSSAIDKP